MIFAKDLFPHGKKLKLIPLTFFMNCRCTTGNGIAFIDSTPLRICDNLRISHHKTFKDDAERGKSSTGGFYGFKLHLTASISR
jgi:hypothetical protein